MTTHTMIPWKCPNCGLETTVAEGLPVHCLCDSKVTDGGELLIAGVPRAFLWGDRLRDVFKLFGFRPWKGCKCGRRQQMLNRAGRAVWLTAKWLVGLCFPARRPHHQERQRA